MRLTTAQKKAMIGIGTLIIFIAAILTAAVAAGVIIRTTGVLQERSYAVAGQARRRMVTGMEVTEVYGNSNRSVPNVPQLEMSIRLRPGASEVNLRQMGLTVTTEDYARAATLQHTSAPTYFNISLKGREINDSEWLQVAVAQIDADLNNDGVADYIRLANYSNSSYDYIQVNISGVGVANVSLAGYIRNATDYSGDNNISLDEAQIEYNDDIYGYISLFANVTNSSHGNNSNTTIYMATSESDTWYFYLAQFPGDNLCNFNTVIPERFYCYRVKIGDTDPILEPGEAYTLYYKFKDATALIEDEEFQIAFVPKDGAITYLYGNIPSVVRKTKVLIWPS